MKNGRQKEILNIISKESVVTQRELIRILRERGYDATQATVSRDIKELRLVKKTDENKKIRYTQSKVAETKLSDEFGGILSGVVTSVESAGNLVVIKTKTGMGMAVATGIDSMGMPEIVGTIAGDDTVFVAVKTTALADHVSTLISRYLIK